MKCVFRIVDCVLRIAYCEMQEARFMRPAEAKRELGWEELAGLDLLAGD